MRTEGGHPQHVRRHYKGRIGTAVSAQCSGSTQPVLPPVKLVGLTTTQLRWIATQKNIENCANQTGITQSRTIGLAFERWVLTTMGQANRWTKPIDSPQRALKNKNNGGLPKSVIPEYVGPLSQWWAIFGGATDLPLSTFFEVKAVAGTLTLSTSQYQIFGLLNVAQLSPAGMSGQTFPTPVLVLTTTSNTTISQDVVAQATAWGVGIWQQIVQYDANSADPTNPDLYIKSPQQALNPNLYPKGVVVPAGPYPWTPSPLTSPTAPLSSFAVQGDPDPAEVD